MKMKIKVVSDGRDDADETIRVNHANCLKIYHVGNFMSLSKFYRSKHNINE
jgi:hypothetical protein